MTYSMETHITIFDDSTGEKITVSPIKDAPELIEIISYDDTGLRNAKILLVKEQAILLSKALEACSK